MKASAFAYARASSANEALKLPAAHGEKAKLLAGGQSLVPAMSLRLISTELLVDIGGLDELRRIPVTNDVVRIGAVTRHVDHLKSPSTRRCWRMPSCNRPSRNPPPHSRLR